MFLYVTNTQAYQRESENEKKQRSLGFTLGPDLGKEFNIVYGNIVHRKQ